MHTIKLTLKKGSYNIVVGAGIIKLLGKYISKLKLGDDAYVITNAAIKNKYGRLLNKTLEQTGFSVKTKLIPDTEESKSLETVSSVVNNLVDYAQKKRIFIIAFGGGVIGDLAGFIASIYKRGIPYIQVPTTLLAQVDSSIGGKTAVDLGGAKNLIGAFYQPRLVFSDVHLLRTLNLRHLKSGLAEVIKYGIIKDMQLFTYLEKKYQDILGLKESTLEFIVRCSSFIKARIVQQDEREEKGIRTILNFGHTLGHAIEAAGGFKIYTHGEAIALGMLAGCDISKKLKLITHEILSRIEGLIERVGLPTIIQMVSLRDIIQAHYHDKKFIGTKNKFVLIKGIGKIKLVENIPLELIKEVLKKRIQPTC